MLCNVRHTLPIFTISNDQKLSVFIYHAGDHGFYTKGPAALHEDGRIVVL